MTRKNGFLLVTIQLSEEWEQHPLKWPSTVYAFAAKREEVDLQLRNLWKTVRLYSYAGTIGSSDAVVPRHSQRAASLRPSEFSIKSKTWSSNIPTTERRT